MFPNLLAELARRRMTRKDLSSEANITYHSLTDKLNGYTPFTLDDMYKIKKVLGNLNLEYLFEKTA